MEKILISIKKIIGEILFPEFCLGCSREGKYLCEDCLSLVDISERQYCPFCSPPKIVADGKTCSHCKRKNKKLNGLYCAGSYDNFLIKKAVNLFKYEPYAKELSKTLASLILIHFSSLEKKPDFFTEFTIMPVPLHKRKIKQRGFNQAEEIAKELAKFLKIPLINDSLIKTKETPAQVELKREEREKNIKGAFLCQKPELVQKRKILLVDDVLTTGFTLEECSSVLKRAGAKEVWGVVTARD